jgi:hypothetical protein
MKSFLTLIFLTLCCGTFSRAQEGEAAAGGIQITEAKLGTGVENRELIGEDSTFALSSKVFLWMKVTGGTSDQITVIWKNGETTHPTTLMIGGSPWRTWATKNATKAGEWSVSVTDTAGSVLKEMTFKVE